MSIFDYFRKKEETRSETLADLLAAERRNASFITKADALNIPAVAASVDWIASTVSTLPVRLYQKTDGRVEEMEDDYRLKLLNRETGDLLDAVQFKRALVSDMLLDGTGWAYVEKAGNKIKGLYYVDSVNVSVTTNNDPIHKAVRILVNGREYRDFEMMRVTRNTNNGVTGLGMLHQYPLLFNTMYNSLKYENNAVSSGTKRGFLKSERRLEPEALERLKTAWRRLTETGNDADSVMVLNQGLSFEAINSTATDNQLNQSKEANSDLVYNAFGLSSGLFSDNAGAEVYLRSVKTAILPVVAALNAALNKFLLLEREKKDYYFAADTSELLKASILERYQGYEIGVKNGWLQIDEIRARENMEPLNLDFVKLGLGDVLYYPETKEIYTVNTGASVQVGESGANSSGKEVGMNENSDQI
jgi:HK97 family phage portal protein